MKKTSELLWIGMLAMLFGSIPVMASDFRVSGFGTASLSCFGSRQADFISNDQPKGPGRSSRCDLGLDSLVGVQFDMNPHRTLALGLQFVAARNADRSYVPQVSVAQLRWRLNDALSLRLGRMPTPAFLHSEDRAVHYAQPWVRPPAEVYGLIPPSSHDGIEFIHASRVGEWFIEWQGGIAATDFNSPRANSHEVYPIQSKETYLALSLQRADTLLKIGYGHGKVSIFHPDAEGLLAGLRQAGATALASDLAIDGNKSYLMAFGLRQGWQDWYVMAEVAVAGTGGYNRDHAGAYVTLGHSHGEWSHYATVARRWSKGRESDARASALGPVMQQAVEALLASSRRDSTSLAVGLSKEIDNKTSLKVQVDRIKPDSNSWGIYTNHAADYNLASPQAEWLFSMSLDFLF